MPACEMCGKDEKLFIVEIEGTQLNVCSQCSSYGKVLKNAAPVQKKKIVVAKRPEKEVIQVIREDFSQLIRAKREELGLKQIELAKKLSERESVIHKIESGSYTPSLALARKLEKHLGLSLIEQREIERQNLKSTSLNLTIGDMIKLK